MPHQRYPQLHYNCYYDFAIIWVSFKVHKEHLDKREEVIAPCKVHYDPNTAKEMLLLAGTLEEQQQWISRLSKKIQKFGYKANSASLGGADGARVSPRYFVFIIYENHNLFTYGINCYVLTGNQLAPIIVPTSSRDRLHYHPTAFNQECAIASEKIITKQIYLVRKQKKSPGCPFYENSVSTSSFRVK